MNLFKKIEVLNRLSEETLSITYFTAWEMQSYGVKSLFSPEGCIGAIRGATFEECLDNAIEAIRQRGYNVKNIV